MIGSRGRISFKFPSSHGSLLVENRYKHTQAIAAAIDAKLRPDAMHTAPKNHRVLRVPRHERVDANAVLCASTRIDPITASPNDSFPNIF
jgi:hypothetical protein